MPRTTKDKTATKDDGTGEVYGEGNYTAARRFREDEEEFVAKNREKIPTMGKEAEKALDGSEGETLRRAEDRATSHSHARGEEK